MTRCIWHLNALVVFLVGLPAIAVAQQADDRRGYVAVSGGLQLLSSEFSDAATFAGPSPVYSQTVSSAATGDPSSFSGAYRIESGTVIDVSGGVRLWRSLGVGGSLTVYRQDADLNVSARLPHPFFLGAVRTIAGNLPLYHDERAVHLHALVSVPVNPAFTVTVFGGPTLFSLRQDLVTDLRFAHSYPYDDATFADAVTGAQSQSNLGFNVGADIAYYFTDTIGVGWLARFSSGTVDLRAAGDRPVQVTVGGFHATGGLRLRF